MYKYFFHFSILTQILLRTFLGKSYNYCFFSYYKCAFCKWTSKSNVIFCKGFFAGRTLNVCMVIGSTRLILISFKSIVALLLQFPKSWLTWSLHSSGLTPEQICGVSRAVCQSVILSVAVPRMHTHTHARTQILCIFLHSLHMLHTHAMVTCDLSY